MYNYCKILKIILAVLTSLLSLSCVSYAACTAQDVVNLKAVGYTKSEIDSLCPICMPEDIIAYANSAISKDDIIRLCSIRTKYEAPVIPMKWYQILITKPIVIGFDAYHTSKVIKSEDGNTNKLTIDKNGDDIFNLYIKYVLPISSMVYAFDESRPEKPHPLLKSWKFYVEGNISNGINSSDASSGVTIKTKTESFYSVGIKFETNVETLFSTGKKYKYIENY